MANSTTTEVNIGSATLQDADFRDDLLTFAGQGTVLAGTILARNSTTGKLVPFVKGGTANGNGTPVAIVTYDVEADAAGDVAVRAAVSGKFRKERLVIDADGDASNVDAVVIDQLRVYGLVAIDVQELGILDNQ